MNEQEQQFEYDYQKMLREYREQEAPESQSRQEGVSSPTLTKGNPKMDAVDLGIALFVAGIFDLLSFVPAVGNIFSVAGMGILWLWFWLKGIPGIGVFAGSGITIEGVPFLSSLPACLGFVTIVYIKSRVGKIVSQLPAPAKTATQVALRTGGGGKLPVSATAKNE